VEGRRALAPAIGRPPSEQREQLIELLDPILERGNNQ
jgi:hypothetical protein